MNTKDRIRAYCEHKGISIRQFEIQSKLSNGYVSSMRKGLGIEKLENVLKAFPDLSREWLLYEEGEMIKGKVRTFELKSDSERSMRQVPVYELAATAGFSYLYNDHSSAAVDYITIPNLPPVDGAIYARGDSMSPLIESGDIIIYKKVDLCPNNILWGNIYIVSYSVDGDDYTVLKYLRHSSREGYIRLDAA